MTKNEDLILDWRSTGRRKARKALFNSRADYICADCGVTVHTPPKDAPPWFNEIWPEDRREVSQLQADHETKDVQVNDIAFLNWRCVSCHKIRDLSTEKGVSTLDVVDLFSEIDSVMKDLKNSELSDNSLLPELSQNNTPSLKMEDYF